MRYLVTGGAGFIGSHVVHDLVARGEDVIVLDNESTGTRDNLKGLEGKFLFVKEDIRDQKAFHGLVEGIDYIIHLAGLGSVPRSFENPLETDAVNVQGTLNILAAARDWHVKKVVFASSSSVYGNTDVPAKSEGQSPHPASPYAVSKLAAEQYCLLFDHHLGVPTLPLRFFNVFGPRQDPHSQYAAVIPKFITALLAGKLLTIFGDGLQSRDFTYVQNVVDGVRKACASETHGMTINLACGGRYTLRSVVKTLEKITGKEATVHHAEPRLGDVRHSCANITRAVRHLDYEPAYSLEDGLRATVLYYQGLR